MPLKFTARFSHHDDWNNAIFTCSEQKQPKSLELAKKLQKRINETVDTYNPIYIDMDKGYARLQSRKSHFRFKPEGIYQLTVRPVLVTIKGRQYANIIVDSSECINQPPEQVEIKLE